MRTFSDDLILLYTHKECLFDERLVAQPSQAYIISEFSVFNIKISY
jgi:hypothetical protein